MPYSVSWQNYNELGRETASFLDTSRSAAILKKEFGRDFWTGDEKIGKEEFIGIAQNDCIFPLKLSTNLVNR